MESNDERTPLWLDCDPARTQDAFAILLAAWHPRLNLLGISTVHGNASLEKTTTNACSILTAINRSDVPVYSGTRKPFCREAVHAPDIHGASGIDGTTLLPTPTVAAKEDTPAILAARNALLATAKHTAYVVATGTFTNVALLFATFPEVAEHVAGVSMMGGAIGGGFSAASLGTARGDAADEERVGNWTKWAEFNVYCDPEAARSILSSPVLAPKTTLIPLDVTHQVLATKDVQDLLLYGPGPTRAPTTAPSTATSTTTTTTTATATATTPTPTSATEKAPSTLRRLLHDLLTFFSATYADVFGLTAGPPLHDPLAVAAIIPAPTSSSTRPADGTEKKKTAAPPTTPPPDIAFVVPAEERVGWRVDVVTEGAAVHLQNQTSASASAVTDSQLGRTVIRPAAAGETGTAASVALAGEREGERERESEARKKTAGVTIPRSLDIAAFWTVLEMCVRRAEEAGV
ncbi:MAG: hypothetical protein M1819_006108 [Sarea resinae]|nr:MAG: hypothetical protein M1819_006108 [Sarea resinae]